MALYKRNGAWWIDIHHQGRRIRKSTRTAVKANAQLLHDQVKADLWKQNHSDARPRKKWVDVVIRWLAESTHKRSIKTDKVHLKWLDPYLRDQWLHEIDQSMIETIACEKEAAGVSPSTVNRLLEIIRAILRKAKHEWEWIDEIPNIRFRKQERLRIRWLTRQEANRLLAELPQHLHDMAAFTLATGLRDANVSQLQWQDVDLERSHALVHPDQSKTRHALAVPLNNDAMAILKKQVGKHKHYVFTYQGNPVTRCNNHAWRKALKRANIENFRWHDLRHTWASWHVQNGTTLQELQQLGGWSNLNMVLRYAHLSSEHLRKASEKICNSRHKNATQHALGKK